MTLSINQFNSQLDVVTLSKSNETITKEQAQKTFWALGDRFWKQIIDGKFHQHGPMVFDEGLHDGTIEPGFLQSLRLGCEFASQHMAEKLSINFYKELHKTLCQHFKGPANSTQMSADQAGNFRDAGTRCRFSLGNFTEESREHYLTVFLYDQWWSDDIPDENYKTTLPGYIKKFQRYNYTSKEWTENKILYWTSQTNTNKVLSNEYRKAKEWVDSYEKGWQEKIKKINDYLESISAQLVTSEPIAYLSIINKTLIQVYYGRIGPTQLERVIQTLFDSYNQKMSAVELGSKEIDQKIDLIAELFQTLEWLHPFEDGQGRTDLVLLAKLLSEAGANPAILEEPYFSSYSLLPDWKDYLLNGIERWKTESN